MKIAAKVFLILEIIGYAFASLFLIGIPYLVVHAKAWGKLKNGEYQQAAKNIYLCGIIMSAILFIPSFGMTTFALVMNILSYVNCKDTEKVPPLGWCIVGAVTNPAAGFMLLTKKYEDTPSEVAN